MKYFIVLCMIFSLSSFFYYLYQDSKEFDIQGVIRVKNGPYIKGEGKSSSTNFSIVYYCDSLKKNIYVNVDPNVFYNSNEGDRIGFSLRRSEFDTSYESKAGISLVIFIFVFAFCFIGLMAIYGMEENKQKESPYSYRGDYTDF